VGCRPLEKGPGMYSAGPARDKESKTPAAGKTSARAS
jgi:hypothetical protein